MENEFNATPTRTQPVKVQLPNGTTVVVEAQPIEGEMEVAREILNFTKVTGAIEGVAETLATVWEKVKPRRATAEFGVEFACEPGELLARFVSASAQASLKITLEWGEPEI